ncbi:MAG: ABC transporter permease subunit [Butyrivibrio sp.]|nr:ABC transporter permease subunit [Butyrivibrio sp.]
MRKDTKKIDMIIIAVLLVIAVLIFYDVFLRKNSAISDEGVEAEITLESYNGKKMGTLAGSQFEGDIKEHFPDSEILYYTGAPELYAALRSGKIDAFAMSEVTMMQMARQHLDVIWLPEILNTRYRYFGFAKTSKGEKLCEQMDIMIAEFNADGTMRKLEDIWYGDDESLKVVDTSGLTGENGVIEVGVSSKDEPYNYIRNNEQTGFNIDIITRFAKRYGYKIEYTNTEPQGLLLGLTTGKFDMLATALSYSEERAQTILFSNPAMCYNSVLAVRANGVSDGKEGSEVRSGVFERFKESFEKNFIREERWKLIAKGIGTTCLITFMATIFGSVLAFGICMFRRTGSALANAISTVFVRIMQGTPIVVILLILYYVVFNNYGLEAVWVAVVGFSLHFGAYTSETLMSGIAGVPAGQREAALALGYTENQTFFYFVLPQAIKRVIPVYRGEVIALLKGTAVAGYITVEDLTKVSDIIQSRTYEAFFPLIAAAIIYFLLSGMISILLLGLFNLFDPRKKKGRA